MSTPGHSPDDRKTKSRSNRKGGRTLHPTIDFGSTENNSKLMSCLNIVNNQLNTRRTYKEDSTVTASVHDQFTSLSKAYDGCQQKILQLEESLMQETLVSEKQRSIIEILKQLLQDSMDDETVLSFLGELSRDTPNSSELCQTIMSIRNVLEKQKLGTYLKNSKMGRLEQGLRTMQQRYETLKSEFIKMEQQNRSYSKEVERLSQKECSARSCFDKETSRLKEYYDKEMELKRVENEEISSRMKQLQRQLERYHIEIGRKQSELNILEDKLRKQEERTYEECSKITERLLRQQELTNELELKLKKLELNQESLRSKYIEEMNQKERMLNVLSSLQELATGCGTSRQPIENSSRAVLSTAFNFGLPNQIRGLLEKKDALIEKYRGRCSKLLASQRSQSVYQIPDRVDIAKTEIFVLKKFLTEQAVRLVGQYEQNPKQYLEKEIVELAKLEAQKRAHLQNCEQELWRMRSKLLQYEEQGSPVRSSELSSQHSKTRLPEQPHARISCSEFHV